MCAKVRTLAHAPRTPTCARVFVCLCVSFDSEAIAPIISPLEEEISS